jgi:predicted porin
MKKIAISALLIGLMGFAQADVSVYGMARVYEESSTVGTAASVTSLTNDKSRIGIKASDAIGNGLTAFVTVETNVGVDAPTDSKIGSLLGDRAALVGLSHKMGSIGFGRDKTALTKSLDSFDAMGGDLFGSSAAAIHSYQGTRLSNAVFVSATLVQGLTGNYVMANSEVAGTANPQSLSLVYSTGPVGVTYARFDNGTTSVSDAIGAKFEIAKTGTTVFGLYSDNKVANVTSQGKSMGVTQTVTPTLSAMASYGENGGLKSYNLGANYALGKNAKVLARYLKETAATDTTRYGAGLEYSF